MWNREQHVLLSVCKTKPSDMYKSKFLYYMCLSIHSKYHRNLKHESKINQIAQFFHINDLLTIMHDPN